MSRIRPQITSKKERPPKKWLSKKIDSYKVKSLLTNLFLTKELREVTVRCIAGNICL